MHLVLSALMALVATSASSRPKYPNGIDLLRSCQYAVGLAEDKELKTEEMVQATYCTGYVSGILDGLGLMGWKGGATRVCVPKDGISNEQAIRIIVKYLKDNPKSLSETGRMVVVISIAEAFPCGTR
jgi:hypothetical protein